MIVLLAATSASILRSGAMSWEVAPDGRFLIITDTSIDTSFTAILNWRTPYLK
jgi:hypothetical protein